MLLVCPRRKQKSDICQYQLRLLSLIGSGVLTGGLPGEVAYSKHYLYEEGYQTFTFLARYRTGKLQKAQEGAGNRSVNGFHQKVPVDCFFFFFFLSSTLKFYPHIITFYINEELQMVPLAFLSFDRLCGVTVANICLYFYPNNNINSNKFTSYSIWQTPWNKDQSQR